MGRRAKNKQAPPEPFESKFGSTARKLGKRKAETGDEVDGKSVGRPTKKVKGSDSSQVKGKSRENANGKKPSSKGKGKRVVSAPQDSSDGWEDVEDDGAHLNAQTRCVLPFPSSLFHDNVIPHSDNEDLDDFTDNVDSEKEPLYVSLLSAAAVSRTRIFLF
jgi:25S rRNA (cytosine2870-C5)-methyltransferase